ncbi:hypothetical protein CIB48_g10407 [Xylaria polymorpha]|nr:hypothetical protein CIB48_g10407 [Xylaria polymorpha]
MSLLIRQPRPVLLCQLCQSRGFSTSYRRLAGQPAKSTPTPKPAADAATSKAAAPAPKFVAPSPLTDAPRSYGKRLEEFTPAPLSRPIGLPYPPEAGQNTGIDFRTWKQRRDDFVNYDKHLERRKDLYVYSSASAPTASVPSHLSINHDHQAQNRGKSG